MYTYTLLSNQENKIFNSDTMFKQKKKKNYLELDNEKIFKLFVRKKIT